MLFIPTHIINIMEIKEETSVRYQGKISLITTIPKTYVKALNIESGDTIEWILDTETEKLELKVKGPLAREVLLVSKKHFKS